MSPTDGSNDSLRRIRHVALDLDGTVYCGSELFPWTLDALAELRALGIGTTFLTNNSSRSAAEYLDHLRDMGIDAAADEIRTSAGATLEHLTQTHPDTRTAYVLGTASLRDEFARAGIRHIAYGAGWQLVPSRCIQDPHHLPTRVSTIVHNKLRSRLPLRPLALILGFEC